MRAVLRRPWFVVVLAALVGAALMLGLGPRPIQPGTARGDAALAAEVQRAVGGLNRLASVSAAVVRDGRVTWAGFGDVTEDSRYELGSITKTFDGLLLADAAERGEVKLTDRLDAHLTELAGTPAGEVTLEELASHRGGLPSLASVNWAQVVVEDLAGKALSAYTTETPESTIAAAAKIHLSGRGTMQYSNLGASLLGFALTRAAGASDWPTYVETRLFKPLGMTQTHIAAANQPAADLMQPHQPNGLPTEPWTGTGYAPAGLGVSTTARDLARYAQAIIDGSAPGASSLDPRWETPYPGHRIGLAWMSVTKDGRTSVWHNGGTGGTRTMLAIDREHKTAALVLTNTSRDVTNAGLVLNGVEGAFPAEMPFDPDTVGWVVVGWFTVVLLVWAALRGRSRVRILGTAAGAVGALLVWWVAQPFDWTPPWSLGLATGLAVGSLGAFALRWKALPWLPPKRGWLAITAAGLGGAWLVAMLALLIGVAAAK